MDEIPSYDELEVEYATSTRRADASEPTNIPGEATVPRPIDRLTSQAGGDLMLSWDGAQVVSSEPAMHAQASSAARLNRSSPEEPPRYSAVQRPTETVCYSFSPMGGNAMAVLPPSDAQDTRPQYYITVSMNCFMPLSHITTIYRGASEHGAFIAEFEMGIIQAASRVCVGTDLLQTISLILFKEGNRTNRKWRWEIPMQPDQRVARKLIWDYAKQPYSCTLNRTGRPLAKFTPHLGEDLTVRQSQLEVTPEGQEFFDHILLSLLIIERKRLAPRLGDAKSLFN